VSFLTMLRHPNIIHLYDSFEYGELYYFIMERARGSIQDLIRTRGPLSEPGRRARQSDPQRHRPHPRPRARHPARRQSKYRFRNTIDAWKQLRDRRGR
jgi:serine/threonine protein kinase